MPDLRRQWEQVAARKEGRVRGAYYNEWEPYAAAWLRNLMAAGHIAPGEVDERDIWDVRPDDLRGFRQVHLFAGIGVWSYALRCAGWPDDRPVFTASCPCQPFSSAGKRRGAADERHLWPAAFHLIDAIRPECVFGEQVASRDGIAWLDLVLSDLAGAGYSAGAVDLCAAGVGAPHIRQRLYFVAESASHGHASEFQLGGEENKGRMQQPERRGTARILADTDRDGARQHARELSGDEGQHEEWAENGDHRARGGGATRILADTEHTERGTEQQAAGAGSGRGGPGRGGELGDSGGAGLAGRQGERGDDGALATAERAGGGVYVRPGRPRQAEAEASWRGATSGFWSDCIWLPCTDGKARSTQPGLFPLAHGATARVGRLRAYGNAIVAPAAEAMILAYMEVAP